MNLDVLAVVLIVVACAFIVKVLRPKFEGEDLIPQPIRHADLCAYCRNKGAKK